MFSVTSDVCTTVKFVCRISIGKKGRDINVCTCFLTLPSLLYWQTSPTSCTLVHTAVAGTFISVNTDNRQHMETNKTEMNTLLCIIICFPPFGNRSFGLPQCGIPPSGIPPSGMIPLDLTIPSVWFASMSSSFNVHSTRSPLRQWLPFSLLGD